MSDFSSIANTDRGSCLPIIAFLLECADVARNEGVLALEELIHEHDNYFLKFVMSMIVDGTDSEDVKSIATILLNSENHTGSALLERLIIIEGVLSVQAGENPRIMEMKLLAYLGEDYLKKRGFCYPSKYKPPVVNQLLRRIYTVVGESPLPECIAFDNAIFALSDSDLQKVVAKIDQKCLVVALKGCGEAVAKKVGNNLSRRLEKMIAEDIEYMGAVDTAVILDEQNKILDVINKLAKPSAIT